MSDSEATELPPTNLEEEPVENQVDEKQENAENIQNGPAAADSSTETKNKDGFPSEIPIPNDHVKPEEAPLITSTSKKSSCRCMKAVCEQVPYVLGVVVYFGLVYGRFLMLTDITAEMVPDVSSRLGFVLTNSLIAFAPVVAAMAFQQWSTNPSHATFARTSFDQTVLLLVNALIMSTYTDCNTLKLIPAIIQIFMVFRLFHWVSLGCRPSIQHLTGSPALVTNTAMLIFNLYMLFCREYIGQDMYGMFGVAPPTEEPPKEEVTNSWF